MTGWNLRLRRFDRARLSPVPPDAVSTRRCTLSDALVDECRRGAAPPTRPWAWLTVSDAEAARRACLQLDGSWGLADASAPGRWLIRGRALWADLARWRPPRPADVWDAGWAPDAAALLGFVPRRATLIVVEGPLDAAGQAALDDLARRAPGWRHALRVLQVLPRDAQAGADAVGLSPGPGAGKPSSCAASASATSMPSTPADMMPPA
jgi:hypothetical protein